jgi:hypothetical protein
MTVQRVTLQLTELRCIRQAESGGSEPYLWVTYFAVGAQPLPFQTGPVATITPSFDAFRTEFPDNMKAGAVASIPPFIASASFDIDTDGANNTVGCIAVLMEEDDTPDSSIILGSIAYSKEIDKQLNKLVATRIQHGDFSPITAAEINTVRDTVTNRVVAAIGSNQGLGSIFTNQDDNLGFAFRAFTGSEIHFQFFDFPEFVSDHATNRFMLSGGLSIGPVPTNPIDVCATPRAHVKAKEAEINSLHTRLTLLQNELQHAPPPAKAAIAAEITATATLITAAEAALPALAVALDSCLSHVHGHPDGALNPNVGVKHGG